MVMCEMRQEEGRAMNESTWERCGALRERLEAGRHGAVTTDLAVAFHVVVEDLRCQVVAAAVPLAAVGVDGHSHRAVLGVVTWPAPGC